MDYRVIANSELSPHLINRVVIIDDQLDTQHSMGTARSSCRFTGRLSRPYITRQWTVNRGIVAACLPYTFISCRGSIVCGLSIANAANVIFESSEMEHKYKSAMKIKRTDI